MPAPHRISSRLAVVRPRVYMAFHDSESGLEGIELLKKEICLDMAADILFGPSSEFFAEQYEAGEIDGDGFGWEIYAEPAFLFAVMGGDVSNAGRLGIGAEAVVPWGSGGDWERGLRARRPQSVRHSSVPLRGYRELCRHGPRRGEPRSAALRLRGGT